MESLSIPESFETFKNRVTEIFKNEGLSENLSSEIKKWCELKYIEYHAHGTSAEKRILIQLEFAQIFGVTEQYDSSWEVLSKAWDYADGMKDAELVKKVEDLMDLIHIRKDEHELP